MNWLIILVAKYFIYLSAALALYVWLTAKPKFAFMVDFLIVGIITFILAKLGAHFYYDPRPFVHGAASLIPHLADNGFPSDHTWVSMFTALVVYHYQPKWGATLIIISLLIGLARVLARVHTPIDIIGSIVFSLISYGCLILIRKYIYTYLTSK
jgi:undecaprenyl-diphosphatase